MSRLARAIPTGERRPERAIAQGVVGMPYTSPSGSERKRPRVHTYVLLATGALRASSSPSARHIARTSGPRATNASGPRSTGTPANDRVRILPPMRLSASTIVTCKASLPAWVRVYAAASPVMPPPRTTTCFIGLLLTFRCNMVMNDVCQRREKTGIAVRHDGALKGQSQLFGCLPCFNVQVVQDFEVVGNKPRSAHNHAFDLRARQFRQDI